jgi:hypothetical protein
MPTARELLEQADALMRRKQETTTPRIEGADSLQGPGTDSAFVPTHGSITTGRESAPPPPAASIPAAAAARTERTDAGARASGAAAVFSAMRWAAPAPPAGTATTSPVFAPPPVTSPRTIQREPIAPSVARTALPVDPTESPLFPPPGPAFAPAGLAEPDFPTLVDAVDAGMLAEHAGDDVPLLTDAIDPLSDEPILEDLDEPSIWSPTFGGATTVRAGAPSQSPAVRAAPSAPPTGRDPLGLDRPPPGFQPAPAAQWGEAERMPAEVQSPASIPEAPSLASIPEVPPLESIPEAPLLESTPEAPLLESIPEAPLLESTPEAPMLANKLAEPAPVAIAVEEMRLPEVAPASLPVAAPAASPPRAVLAPLDDARVREIAEEIGMQVLQRIDIFTDTELRTRLGERLKPVVDRVSADLVAAINEHVGELLRAYVAEAIEREIDGWRDRQT